VAQEYQKLNSPEMRANKQLRDEQEMLANAKRLEWQGQVGNYGSIIGYTLERFPTPDSTSVLAYYNNKFRPDMAKILAGISGLRPAAAPAEDSTRGLRGTVEAGVVARDSVNRGIVQTGDAQKMQQTDNRGLSYPITNKENSSNFGVDSLRSSPTGTRTGRVRVGSGI
jgi:hypothetical protein